MIPELLNKYEKVINFRRNDNVEIINRNSIVTEKLSEDLTNNYHSNLLINLATHYDPIPKNKLDEKKIEDANVNFPIKILKKIKNNIKVINTSSYIQLLDEKYQIHYSKTKNIFLNHLIKSQKDYLNLYMFDTFGTNDYRNKVVDRFIINILLNKELNIPSNPVFINLTHISIIVKTILYLSENSMTGNYLLKSSDTILLEDLALKLMQIIGKTVNINKVGKQINYIDMIDDKFENILLSNDAIFEKNLEMRINEIRKTITL